MPPCDRAVGRYFWCTVLDDAGDREQTALPVSGVALCSMEETTYQALNLDHLHVILRQIGLDVFSCWDRS